MNDRATGRGKFLAESQASSIKEEEAEMNEKSPLIRACLVLTLFCGVGAVIVAIAAATMPTVGSNSLVPPVLNTLVSMFGLSGAAFFLKGLGG
ncbi:hypothetical protein [Mesorhizobium sp.]|uniref:hypothetical protein n=1 Tax=Mesorhizobium sp. TaxID=1871066 RepID=UPI0011FF7C1E|nr:hypothetical protein [Mesorhizobium sp.]TIN24758.1 MAG: hypothetical protein E5Y19_21565 [Mesorhizobium sp.]TJU87901.1 MAG: hypothetical protein E5Y15_05190 [Mesorhizobium sp.]